MSKHVPLSDAAPPSHLFQNVTFLVVWMGETISTLGGSFSTLASSWLAYQITGSVATMGNMLLIYFLPSLFMQLVIGPYIDRWNRRKVMVYSQWARGLVSLAPLLLLLNEQQVIWPLYLVSLVNGLIQPLYVPSSMAFLPTLVSKEQITSANACLDGTSRLMMVIGPPVGGFVVSAIGGEFTLVLVSIAYGFSGMLLFTCKTEHDVAIISTKKDSWSAQFIEGFDFFRQRPTLLWLGIFLSFVQFALGVTSVLNLPFVVNELHGKSFQYGLFIAGYPLGYFFGSLIAGRQKELKKRRLVMIGSLLFGGSTFVALAFTHNIWIAVTIELLAGVAGPFFHVHSNSFFQKIVPNNLLGRVLSVRLLIIRTAMPLGILLGSRFSEIWGVRPLFALIGVIVCFVSFLGLMLPYFRFLDIKKSIEAS
ncbi:MFS transporter [Brevibacillus centrosporus]|uniref:Predicted arabinose efflux permease, MFS family n=1 Tax=Brevibacillus centrosporus TaxID=54910 RepID=A0A1I4C2S7_9BACL|nr:MFS transporter [Brevibacillus centrosporus]MEC2128874.1 MFS transporter [Brevibacillus centrosporus]MED4907639.1 MFS transporter [Brevibacillus centrosporus]RNB67082.1 MFS transporter [Brevibacillus centrosporus]SFK75235.1 Predicted arabinose efflux permease, MFS family [Brevibacillus centrosporus]